MLNFAIVIEKDDDSDYGVTVPDLPGCFTAGKTIDEALAMAKEAIELQLEGLIEEGEPIPRPGSIQDLQSMSAYKKGTWAVVQINPSSLRLRTKRINISIPERILEAVDRHAEKEGESRSGLLVRAITEYMGRQPIRRRQKKQVKSSKP